MRNIKLSNFEIEINASVEKVWDKMLGDEGYRVWTMEFNPGGSWYEKENPGEFVVGEKVKFLGPDGEGKLGGMLSTVKEIRKNEFISFEHYGFIMNSLEDTESEKIKSWAPAFENYTFESLGDNLTKIKVAIEMSAEWSDMMAVMWPKALEKLKEICEK
jgi:uncharacterized protein YndB with AHSA1/START domain